MTPQEQTWIQQLVGNLQTSFDQKLNQAMGAARHAADKRMSEANESLKRLATIADVLKMERTGGLGVTRVEDLPGRRVPFDLLVDIPIGNNTTSIRENSVTISQEGPFVAVKRFATFQSALEYQITSDNGATAKFSGRSFGRYRPIHSAWDLNDAQAGGQQVTQALPLIVGALVAMPEMVGSMSGFRSMEFDGRILCENAGSSFPRQNISVPSSFWTPEINAPQDLGCLDFFERGEVITFRVQPNHVNNPPAGNADGSSIFGVTGWPFLDGQFDRHEGIVTPEAFTVLGDPAELTALTTDPIQRLPDGILTIGFLGYRIQQPIGPVT